MTCDHPDCTGVHGHRRPYAEWCPAAKQRLAHYQKRGATGERHRFQDRRAKRKRATARDLQTLRRLRGSQARPD